MKAEAKKENQPDPRAPPGPGPVWFEPYTKTKPWREPLKERQIQEKPVAPPVTSADTSGKAPSALVRLSLQEALELRRPDFISRSRERMKRLELQVEERRLQAVFDQEREKLFNLPGHTTEPVQPEGLQADRKRAIPRREMFMRSKQIYYQLPEVKLRLEEERRKAEYRSYRLKAQLYKKKITNRILGRKTPWQ
ncbi:Alstrom syndrome protein 1 homolog [Megalops cyprinoides]|uniref:Alstrom syndrome protein 1 homolog n=1 Tax=Megalops cyprinoides TaxID=118141 RepID=UPI001864CDA4|nr:Alstrom syndrome protein 1 homolog [Megalops cyprinoides]